jgi:hypothetical protein
MTSPPAVRPNTQPSIRLDEKEGRASGAARRVRIVSDYGLVDTCSSDDPRLQRYLNAGNAEVIRTYTGKLVTIRLHSVANDHGHLGEGGGNSNITTCEERLACGPLLQHKPSRLYLPQWHARENGSREIPTLTRGTRNSDESTSRRHARRQQRDEGQSAESSPHVH